MSSFYWCSSKVLVLSILIIIFRVRGLVGKGFVFVFCMIIR